MNEFPLIVTNRLCPEMAAVLSLAMFGDLRSLRDGFVANKMINLPFARVPISFRVATLEKSSRKLSH
jgi:hypothetical protein